MALFRLGALTPPAHLIRAGELLLRPPQARDFAQWAELRAASRAFLTPWEPAWPADDLTRSAYRRRVRRVQEEIERDEAYGFFIFREADQQLLGGLTLGQIRRGVAQTGTLGYWMGAAHAGRGHMSAAVRAVCRYGFENLRLHRIEASCLLHNEASIRVLERCGFRREGEARAYLRINGAWQDHLLFALLETDPIPAANGGA